MSKSRIHLLSRIAIMAALYVLLNNTIAIKAGNLRITFASLPVVVMALLFGPLEAMLTALAGEFINQLTGQYGISVTLPLWLLPPAIRGLIVGLAAQLFRRSDRPLERRPLTCYAVCLTAAVATTLANTLAIAIDAVIGGYATEIYIFGQLAHRIVSGIVVSLAVTTLAIPVVRLLPQHLQRGVS